MKSTTVVLLIIFVAATAVVCRRNPPALKPFPSAFTMTVNASGTIQTIYLDLPNKRARIDVIGTTGPEEWYLMYSPPGAQPGSPASQHYTLLAKNSDSNYIPVPPPNNCYYETTTGMEAYDTPFPITWLQGDETYQVGPWFELPNDMIYSGEYFISELGVMSDRWDSQTKCDLSEIGMGIVPCTSIMYSQDSDAVPLMDIQAAVSHWKGHIFDSYYVRVYNSFVASVHNKDFVLPQNWPIYCSNADLGYNVQMSNVGWVYSNTPANFTISLLQAPVQGLGSVKVTFKPSPSFPITCTDCVSFPNSVVFTKDNWNIPVLIPVKYLKDGCSQYIVVASGGGYEWTIQNYWLEFYSCKDYTGNTCNCPASGK